MAFAILLTETTTSTAQSVNEIKNSKDYLWAEGEGESVRQAEKMALEWLMERAFTDSNYQFDDQVLTTYTKAFLQNTTTVEITKEPTAKVFRYMSIDDVKRIINNRIEKVNQYVKFANTAERKGYMDVALQNYYWANCLLASLPNADEMRSPDPQMPMKTWIPNQMDEIFANIKVQKQKVDGEFVTLYITYKGEPVSRLDYTYFDGRGMSNIHSAVDGIGFMEMYPGVSTDNLRIKCEYEYESQVQLDEDVEAVIDVIKKPWFKIASIQVDDLPSHTTGPMPKQLNLTTLSEKEVKTYEDILNQVANAINNKDYKSVNQFFTEEAAEMFHQLVKYGQARVLNVSNLIYIKDGNEVLCRSIPMSFSFKNNLRKFVENVTFIFDANQKIRSVAFGLEEEAAAEILTRNDYPEKARLELVKFLEDYKTAFTLKRIDCLNGIFDEQAINLSDQKTYVLERIVKYNRFTMKEYFAQLRRVFSLKGFVNLRLFNFEIVKGSEELGEVYGIKLWQDYYCSSYGDRGYLFLVLDLNNPDKPTVKLATYQNEKDHQYGWYDWSSFY